MKKWDVKVKKVSECWIEIEADTEEEAIENAIDEAICCDTSVWVTDTIDGYATKSVEDK